MGGQRGEVEGRMEGDGRERGRGRKGEADLLCLLLVIVAELLHHFFQVGDFVARALPFWWFQELRMFPWL